MLLVVRIKYETHFNPTVSVQTLPGPVYAPNPIVNVLMILGFLIVCYCRVFRPTQLFLCVLVQH
jgi:hypothetical protein